MLSIRSVITNYYIFTQQLEPFVHAMRVKIIFATMSSRSNEVIVGNKRLFKIRPADSFRAPKTIDKLCVGNGVFQQANIFVV